MKKLIIIFQIAIALATFMVSCSPTEEQIQLTIENQVALAISATWEMLPTKTLKPTYTPLPTLTFLFTYTPNPELTPIPTLTLLPTLTDRPTLTPLPTYTPTPTPTITPTPLPTLPPLPTAPPVDARQNLWSSISITRQFYSEYSNAIQPVCHSHLFNTTCSHIADCQSIVSSYDTLIYSFNDNWTSDDPVVQHALAMYTEAKNRIIDVHDAYVNDCRNAIANGQTIGVPENKYIPVLYSEVNDILHQAMAMLEQE